MSGRVKLTERQRDVLNELVYATRNDGSWTTPLGIGGSGYSGTSGVLKALEAKGFAQSKQRWGNIGDTARQCHMSRGSKEYRATTAGREAMAAHAAQSRNGGAG